MEIVLVGLNHRTTSLELRERVSFTADQARRAADELRSRGLLEESLVLSTCNRSEVYGVPPEACHECAPGLSSFLSEFHSIRPDALNGVLYHHYDRAAVRHLFRVSAGLDSLLLGEAEILGQVRDAYRLGRRKTRRAHLWQTRRPQRPGPRRRNRQRTSRRHSSRSRHRPPVRNE